MIQYIDLGINRTVNKLAQRTSALMPSDIKKPPAQPPENQATFVSQSTVTNADGTTVTTIIFTDKIVIEYRDKEGNLSRIITKKIDGSIISDVSYQGGGVFNTSDFFSNNFIWIIGIVVVLFLFMRK